MPPPPTTPGRAVLCPWPHWCRRLVTDRRLGGEVGLLTDEDAVDRRRSLQAGGGVHHVTGDHRLAERRAGAEGHDRLAGVHRRSVARGRLGQFAGDVADRQRGPYRALGVVAVRDRRAEDAHHRVADELLDGRRTTRSRSDAIVIGLSSARTSSGSSCSARPVKPTRSTKMIVTSRRSSAGRIARTAKPARRGRTARSAGSPAHKQGSCACIPSPGLAIVVPG